MNFSRFEMLRNFLTAIVLLSGVLLGFQSKAKADEHLLTLTIAWNNETGKITVKREGLQRAISDTDTWIFHLELAGDLEMVTGPTWSKETKVNGAAQAWGLWQAIQDDPRSYSLSTPQQPNPNSTFLAKATGHIRRRGAGGEGGGVGGGDDGIDFEADWSGKTDDLSVVFTPDIARVGFAKKKNANGDMVPDLDSPIGKITVTAKVTPKEATSNINIVVGEGEGITNRVAISNVVKDAGTGQITFDLRGTSASQDRNGDSLVVAKKIDDGKVVGSEKVVVIVPQTIGRPFPQVIGRRDNGDSVTADNKAVNGTSTPAFFYKDNNGLITPVPQGKVTLRTYYQFWQTVSVVDQFNLPLDSLYQGSEVGEQFPINQQLTAQGTYQDPVGYSKTKLDNDGNAVEVLKDSQGAKDWEDKVGAQNSPIPLGQENLSDPANTDVFIAGHKLAPGIENRQITFYPGLLRACYAL